MRNAIWLDSASLLIRRAGYFGMDNNKKDGGISVIPLMLLHKRSVRGIEKRHLSPQDGNNESIDK